MYSFFPVEQIIPGQFLRNGRCVYTILLPKRTSAVGKKGSKSCWQSNLASSLGLQKSTFNPCCCLSDPAGSSGSQLPNEEQNLRDPPAEQLLSVPAKPRAMIQARNPYLPRSQMARIQQETSSRECIQMFRSKNGAAIRSFGRSTGCLQDHPPGGIPIAA